MTITPQRLHLGTAWYPEHWPETRWTEDIRLMKAAGISVARAGEFAWSSFEPSEGEFRLDWLARAVDLLAQNGIRAVLGTPTAAPPAWLTARYPETLAVDEHGHRREHGRRCHYCVNSPDYNARVGSIVEALAARFGKHSNVIGWQIDNEFGTVCYCDTCRAGFQRFLAEKFGSLDALNEHWATAYWSQSYTAWEQIPLPKKGHNPGLLLAFREFVTRSYRNFQRRQIDILRPHLREGVWITHNFMNWWQAFDHYALSEDLDLASWEWYLPSGHHNYLESGAMHDLVRGFKQRNFWVMETQPGSVNWAGINNTLNQGEAQALAWHAVGHGADALLYWQWRPALNGQEQYHGSLVDQSGQPRPFYDEAAHLGAAFEKVSDLLTGSSVVAQIAIIHDYASRWSLDEQRHHKDFDYIRHLLAYYKPLAKRNLPVDILSPDAPLDPEKYKLVIVPALAILTPMRARRLREYAENGGTLLLTIRTGVKDAYNALQPERPPGALAKLAGVEVEEYYALKEKIPLHGTSAVQFTGTAKIWAERLRTLDEDGYGTQIIAEFKDAGGFGWLDGFPAATARPIGDGMVYYFGGYFDERPQAKLIGFICESLGLEAPLDTPDGVELCQRVTPEGEKIYILINHQARQKKFPIPWTVRDHISGYAGKGQVVLPPYGTVVLTILKSV